MRKRFFSIIVCVVMLFTMNVTAFAAETQENYSETEKSLKKRNFRQPRNKGHSK